MRNVKQLLMLLATVIGMTSCSVLQPTDGWRKIKPRMTQEEVLAICKEPQYKRFDEMGEEWEYRLEFNYDVETAIVNFVDGRVVALDMFKSYMPRPAQQPSATIVVGSGQRPELGYRPDTGYRPGNVMSEKEFDLFHQSLKNAFSPERFPKIKLMLKNTRLTSAQGAELVEFFAFSSEKVKLAKMIYPRIVDKDNFELVVEKLDYFDQKKVNEFIEQ